MITEQDINDLLAWGEIDEVSARALRMRLQMNRTDATMRAFEDQEKLMAEHDLVRSSGLDLDVPCIAIQGSPLQCVCRNCRGARGYGEEGRP